jgi:hypothetical protein
MATNPTTHSRAELADALPKVKKFEAHYRARAVGLFLVGALVTLIAPLIIAGVVKFRETTNDSSSSTRSCIIS